MVGAAEANEGHLDFGRGRRSSLHASSSVVVAPRAGLAVFEVAVLAVPGLAVPPRKAALIPRMLMGLGKASLVTAMQLGDFGERRTNDAVAGLEGERGVFVVMVAFTRRILLFCWS